MPLITQGPEGEQVPYRARKTNWKFLLLIIILAVIVGAGSLYYLQCFHELSFPYNHLSVLPKVFSSEEECKEKTECEECAFVDCDVIPPDKTLEEVCGKDFKPGWQCIKPIDETAEWKACINEEYGFEIKHPNEWVKDEHTLFPEYVKEVVDSAPSCTFFISKTKRIPEDVWISISIRSCETSSCDPREEIEEPYRKGIKQSIIKGRSVFIFDEAFEGERSLNYIFVNETKTRQAWLSLSIHHGRQTGTEYLPDKEIDPELQIFNQMLSTFRFIDDFCGTSTYGTCSTDSDCMATGCSGQVCWSKNEESIVTTCEWKECYRAQDYGLSCKCVDQKCQWLK